jgi:hypothetical protein
MREEPGVRRLPDIKPFVVVTGHYGSGKTNLSINLALDFARERGSATLVDLDVVNPYFRSSDYTAMLELAGVHVISPTFAGTTLDTPTLSAEVYSAFGSRGAVIIDVGGDDAGATALGRYSAEIGALDHDLLYVINRYRNLIATPAEAAALLTEIEAASHLKATGVVNNSHLRDETTAPTVLDSMPYARETAGLLGLPLVFSTVPVSLVAELCGMQDSPLCIENAYPVEVYVRFPWENRSSTNEENG